MNDIETSNLPSPTCFEMIVIVFMVIVSFIFFQPKNKE